MLSCCLDFVCVVLALSLSLPFCLYTFTMCSSIYLEASCDASHDIPHGLLAALHGDVVAGRATEFTGLGGILSCPAESATFTSSLYSNQPLTAAGEKREISQNLMGFQHAKGRPCRGVFTGSLLAHDSTTDLGLCLVRGRGICYGLSCKLHHLARSHRD